MAKNADILIAIILVKSETSKLDNVLINNLAYLSNIIYIDLRSRMAKKECQR